MGCGGVGMLSAWNPCAHRSSCGSFPPALLASGLAAVLWRHARHLSTLLATRVALMAHLLSTWLACRRVEVVGVSTEEFFLGRPDRLLSRKVKYGPPDVTFLGAGGPGLQRRGSLMLGPAIRRDSLATPATGDSR